MTAANYQVDFNGTVIGNGTDVILMDHSGFEQWSTRGSDVPLPTAWGDIPGSSYVESKVVALSVRSQNRTSIAAFEAALIGPTMAAPDALVPVRWKFPDREEFLCYGRCGRRNRVRSVESDTATFNWQFDFELEFPDPRVYAAVLQQVSLTVFVAGGSALDYTVGTGVDLAFEYTVGAGVDLAFEYVGISSSGLQTLTNLGYVDTYPLIVFSPATGISSFSVTNQTTGQVFTVNQTVNVGQTLVADMQAAATATGSLGNTSALPVSIGGVSVYGSWVAPRIPLRLVPGNNILKFSVTAGDTAAAALVTAPSAYL